MADSNRISIQSCAFWSFALSFALLPIGLGGNRPIPLGLAQLGLAFSTLCLGLNYVQLATVPFYARLRVATALLVLALIWALIQIMPFVPASWTHPLWQDAAKVLGKSVSSSISVSPEDSVAGLMRLVTYIIAGVLAYVYAQDGKRARQIVEALWITGTVICAYGLSMYVLDFDYVLWFKKWAYDGDLTATFVNRNHFALYAGTVLVAGVALFFQSWSRALHNCKPHQRVEIIREWLLYKGMPRAVALMLVFVCLPLSHSRAGITFSILGVAAYIVLYQVYRRSWTRAAVIGFFVIVFLALAAYAAPQLSDRFSVLFDDYSSQERSKVYEITWRAFTDNPWLGYGIGGFEPEYRLYQHGMFEEFNHAHSDVLESLIDYGAVAAGMLWVAIVLLLSGLWHGITSRRHEGMFPVLGLTASLMVLGHSCVDFDLQIPGLAMTWTVLMGTGLAQSWPQAEKNKALGIPSNN